MPTVATLIRAAAMEADPRFDGRIDPEERAAAKYGPALANLIRAKAEVALFRSMVRGQVETIRKRRADGSFYPALLTDLAMYRLHHRGWNRIAHQLARQAGIVEVKLQHKDAA